MAVITERENRQIERTNASGRPSVLFIHGLWLLPSSWDRWAQAFEEAGYAALTPSWPDDPETVEQPAFFANGQIQGQRGVEQRVVGQERRLCQHLQIRGRQQPLQQRDQA